MTVGEPLYCNYCGASYDVKLCPARHVNPRSAEVCSQCGSRDLSTPAPRAPMWRVPLLYLLSLVPGVLLTLISLMVVIALVNVILTNQQVQSQLVVLILMLAMVWWLYIHLPGFVRSLFRTIWRKSKTERRQR